MYRIIIVSLLLALLSLQGFSQKKSKHVKQHRIVMQLSSNDTLVWKGLMNNLKNLKAGWGDSVVIVVVAHGPGLDLLTKGKTTQQEKIAHFHNKGITFMACENTMRERNIPKESIISEAVLIPMGMGEIVRKQEQGWSYIKTGF
jgi:hypothetical protein